MLLKKIVVCVSATICSSFLVAKYLQPPENVHSILLFDGVCNLCNTFVNIVADGDSKRNVKFGAQQKHMDLLDRLGAPKDLSTVVLVQGDKYWTRTAAVMKTFALMDPIPWHILTIFYLLPSPVGDFFYKLVAKYRYKVFGVSDTCRVPTESFKGRFIDDISEEDKNEDIDGNTSFNKSMIREDL